MPSRHVSTSFAKPRGSATAGARTFSEEAGQVLAQHTAPRLRNAIDAALDVVDNIPILQVAVAAVEANSRGRHNRGAHFDFRRHSRRLWQRNRARKAQSRAQQ
jgi:hypothetical protein